MSAQGKLSPRNARRLIREYGLEDFPIVDVIATYDSGVVLRTRNQWHFNVHRRTGEMEAHPCRIRTASAPGDGYPACWTTCSDLPNWPLLIP